MTAVYSSGFEPNPMDASSVLAFVLCSPGTFVPGSDERDREAVVEMIQPAKEEAIRRWKEAQLARHLIS